MEVGCKIDKEVSLNEYKGKVRATDGAVQIEEVLIS